MIWPRRKQQRRQVEGIDDPHIWVGNKACLGEIFQIMADHIVSGEEGNISKELNEIRYLWAPKRLLRMPKCTDIQHFAGDRIDLNIDESNGFHRVIGAISLEKIARRVPRIVNLDYASLFVSLLHIVVGESDAKYEGVGVHFGILEHNLGVLKGIHL